MNRTISWGWIAVLALLFAFPATADVLLVGPGQTYTTIQSAVDAANAYDTIIVYPGNYDEDVTLRPNKDGLTILSTEVSSRGENTVVKAFSLVFAPAGGPDNVTIAGFTVGPGGDDNGVCMESSGDYTTFAYNKVLNCNYDGIRVNRSGNFYNNIHHNELICYAGGCVGTRNAIELEGPGSGSHNVHHNAMGSWYVGINVGSDNTIVHQNEIRGAYNKVVRVSGDDNFVHHNIACGTVQVAFDADETKLQHNEYQSLLDQGTDTKEKKNEILISCPFD